MGYIARKQQGKPWREWNTNYYNKIGRNGVENASETHGLFAQLLSYHPDANFDLVKT